MDDIHVIELNDAELKIIHSALRSYLEDFGHDEADILRAVKALLAKMPSGEHYFDE
jgi:hypothetical protein